MNTNNNNNNTTSFTPSFNQMPIPQHRLQQPQPFLTPPAPPPPPAPSAPSAPPPPPQQQHQQQIAPALQKYFSDHITSFPIEFLEQISDQIRSRLRKTDDKCSLSHIIQTVPNDARNPLLEQFQKYFQEYNARLATEKNDRLFDTFCDVCVYQKLGLYSENVVKNLQSFTCRNTRPESGHVEYNLGPFIHAINPYKTNQFNHPIVTATLPSERMAFPAGSLILPSGKILMQLLALPQEMLTRGGLKIIQITSEESGITNPDIYARFMARNSRLDCGYYKRELAPDDVKKLNAVPAEGEVVTPDDQRARLQINKGFASAIGNSLRRKIFPSVTIDPKQLGLQHIPDVDTNFNHDEIFTNGEPLSFIAPNQQAEQNEIGMKIFDFNPVFITYLQNMINIQAHLQTHNNMGKSKTQNKDENYMNRWGSGVIPLVSSTYYDILSMAFLSETNQDKLMDIPPLNDKCLLAQHNILLVNKNGDCIMSENNADVQSSRCTLFNKVLINPEISLSQRILPTVSSRNVDIRGNSSSSKTSPNYLTNLQTGYSTYHDVNKTEPLKHKFSNIFDHHQALSLPFQRLLKNDSENLKNYFCSFKDDMNIDVPLLENEVIYDIATHMYPQRITDANPNKQAYSLDYAIAATSQPIIDETNSPNMVYVSNLGFVALQSICDHSPMILKNTEVYFQNLTVRESKNYISKTSENCKYSELDDDNSVTTYTSVNLTPIPLKRKHPDNVVNLSGGQQDDNYDYLAFTKMAKCNTPNFNQYLTTYSTNTDNRGCLRNV